MSYNWLQKGKQVLTNCLDYGNDQKQTCCVRWEQLYVFLKGLRISTVWEMVNHSSWLSQLPSWTTPVLEIKAGSSLLLHQTLKDGRSDIPAIAQVVDQVVLQHACQHLLLMQVGVFHTHEMPTFLEEMSEIMSLSVQTEILCRTPTWSILNHEMEKVSHTVKVPEDQCLCYCPHILLPSITIKPMETYSIDCSLMVTKMSSAACVLIRTLVWRRA